MRKLLVSTLTTLDGYYEGKDRNLGVLFDCFHEGCDGDKHFDASHLERWRAADTFLLRGRTSFLVLQCHFFEKGPHLLSAQQSIVCQSELPSRAVGSAARAITLQLSSTEVNVFGNALRESSRGKKSKIGEGFLKQQC